MKQFQIKVHINLRYDLIACIDNCFDSNWKYLNHVTPSIPRGEDQGYTFY